MKKFDSLMTEVIDSTLGRRCKSYGYHEKYDAKPTYKKFNGYSPDVGVIGEMIVNAENRDGNTNVRFHQQETLERTFTHLENSDIHINRARMDCGSCSSLYNDIFSLRGWRREEINGVKKRESSMT